MNPSDGVSLPSNCLAASSVHGAAGVLRKLGFEIRNAREPAESVAAQEPGSPAATGPDAPTYPHAPAYSHAPSARGPRLPAEALRDVDPKRCLLIITCSATKQPGGQAPNGKEDNRWAPELREARAQVLPSANLDMTGVLPAWRRYIGTFYQHANPALADAVTHGHVLIISGGYGILRAEELIGWYDRQLNLADWPRGVLESALISEAHHRGLGTAVAFASATTSYAQLLNQVPWRQAGINARLVTVGGVTEGAMGKESRQLGQAFSAFWTGQHACYPPGAIVESLPLNERT